MEDDLNILVNGRRPHFLKEIEDNPNLWQMEDYISFLVNGKRPQCILNKK